MGNAVIRLKNLKTQFMELTSSQSDAIRYILKNYDAKQITASDLMKNLQLYQSTLAGIIQRLERKELLRRQNIVWAGLEHGRLDAVTRMFL